MRAYNDKRPLKTIPIGTASSHLLGTPSTTGAISDSKYKPDVTRVVLHGGICPVLCQAVQDGGARGFGAGLAVRAEPARLSALSSCHPRYLVRAAGKAGVRPDRASNPTRNVASSSFPAAAKTLWKASWGASSRRLIGLAAQMGWASKEHQVCLAHLIRDAWVCHRRRRQFVCVGTASAATGLCAPTVVFG
jgi:hypothetical protein